MNKIVVTGHPYAYSYYFRVFEKMKNKDEMIFVLPRLWLAKKGKVRIKLESKAGFKIYGLAAASFGGRGITGLFKGFLPGIFFLLPYLKLKYGSKVLYSCSEPYLLTTLFNGLMANFCGMKFIFFTWQNVEPKKYLAGFKLKIYSKLIRMNLNLADGIICGNQKSQEIMKMFTNHDLVSKTLVCPLSGVDVERFHPGIESDWRDKLGIKMEERMVLFYGALDTRKGLEILVDAFKLLIDKNAISNTRLVLVGTGPEKQNLESKIKNLELNDKITILDWLPNDQLPALLNVVDVFVYPSVPQGGWEEQFGYAMAEASACGVPVVATRTGSIDEVVVHEKSGLLVQASNPEELSKALFRIISDENMAKEMGKFGREYVVTNFSHPVIAEKIAKFLEGFV